MSGTPKPTIRRMCRLPFLMAFVVSLSQLPPPRLAWSQIETPAVTTLGTPGIARSVGLVSAEADAAYAWHIETRSPDGRCSILPVEGTSTAHYWGTVGRHKIYLVEAVADLDGIKTKLHTQVIEITDELSPDPVDEGLADLVSVESAAVLATLHADWSVAVREGLVQSREEFDAGYQIDRASLQLDDADRAYQVIDKRLSAIEGIAESLTDALTAIAAEFGKTPSPDPEPPPEPSSGPRVAIVVRETANDTPQRAAAILNLRRGNESQYLRDHNHRVLFLDDDAVDGDGNRAPLLEKYASEIESTGIPMLIIIDAESETVLKVEALGNGWTAANITEKIRQTGG